jgi:hypothetical protein
MCRAEAHQLYAKKPIFDALGIRLFAVLHEHIESEVSREFQLHNLINSLSGKLMCYCWPAGKRLLASILGWCCALR